MIHNLSWSVDSLLNGVMPHWMCIGSGWNIAIIAICGLLIGFGYFAFFLINRKIVRTHAGSDYFVTQKVWMGFGQVFVWCGIKSLLMTMVLFWSWYWLLSIVMAGNAFWILYTVRHFKRHLPAFQAKTVPLDEALASERDLRTTISELRLEVAALKAEKTIKDD